MTVRQLLLLVSLITLCLFPPLLVSAAQAAHTFEEVTQRLTFSYVLVLTLMATLSGAAALLYRLRQELRDAGDGVISRPWLFVCTNMLSAWVASVLAVALAQSQNAGVWTEIGMVISASFGGARVIEAVAERYFGPMSNMGRERLVQRGIEPRGGTGRFTRDEERDDDTTPER